MSLTRPLAGRLLDRRGPALVLTAGILLLMAGFFVLGKTDTLPLFVVAAAVLGVGYGNVSPTLQAMAINLVEPHRRGAASSTLLSGREERPVGNEGDPWSGGGPAPCGEKNLCPGRGLTVLYARLPAANTRIRGNY